MIIACCCHVILSQYKPTCQCIFPECLPWCLTVFPEQTSPIPSLIWPVTSPRVKSTLTGSCTTDRWFYCVCNISPPILFLLLSSVRAVDVSAVCCCVDCGKKAGRGKTQLLWPHQDQNFEKILHFFYFVLSFFFIFFLFTRDSEDLLSSFFFKSIFNHHIRTYKLKYEKKAIILFISRIATNSCTCFWYQLSLSINSCPLSEMWLQTSHSNSKSPNSKVWNAL